MRPEALKVPPVNVPAIVIVLAAPAAPAVPGTVTVVLAVDPPAIDPITIPAGAAVVLPIFTDVRTTLFAAVPPVLASVTFTEITPFARLSVQVEVTLAGVTACAGAFTSIVRLVAAPVQAPGFKGVNETESSCSVPIGSTVPNAGL